MNSQSHKFHKFFIKNSVDLMPLEFERQSFLGRCWTLEESREPRRCAPLCSLSALDPGAMLATLARLKGPALAATAPSLYMKKIMHSYLWVTHLKINVFCNLLISYFSQKLYLQKLRLNNSIEFLFFILRNTDAFLNAENFRWNSDSRRWGWLQKIQRTTFYRYCYKLKFHESKDANYHKRNLNMGNLQLQLLVVCVLALLATTHAQSGPSKQDENTRGSRFIPSLIVEKVASFFRRNSPVDSSNNDKTSRSDSIPQVEDEELSKGEEESRSSVLPFRIINPIHSIYKKASTAIASVASKIKNNLSSRISIPTAFKAAASKKDDGIADRNSLANIIAKDISMNLEEEIERTKKSNKYDHRKISHNAHQKLDIELKKVDSTKSETQIQTVDEPNSYSNDKFSPKDLVSSNMIEDESDGYDPFFSIRGADPEIVRHFDPDGDSTQFILGEKREEPQLNPFAILYHLYSAWGEEPGEEKYDARGFHVYD